MENKTYFFREIEEVEEKIQILKDLLNKDNNEILDNFIIISDNCTYLNNCLNSYREVRYVLDPHLSLLVHAFSDFLKRSFNLLNEISEFFEHTDLLEYQTKKQENIKLIESEKPYLSTKQNKNDEEKEKHEKEKEKEKEEKTENENVNVIEKEKEKEKEEKIKLYNIVEEIYKYYNTLISVRGEKKIKTLFPCDLFCLNKIIEMLLLIKKKEKVFDYLSTFKNEEYDENNMWIIIYVLLIWLSFCLYLPFHLTNVNKNMLSDIEEIYYYFLKRNGKSNEACSILFAQFFYRKDVFRTNIFFHHFLIFSKEVIMKLIHNKDEEKEKENVKKKENINQIEIIQNKDLPNYCTMPFSHLILHGILLTHKRILKKLDVTLLINYANFYNFFFIQNCTILDVTQRAKALKISCLSYYALLFLEKKELNNTTAIRKQKVEDKRERNSEADKKEEKKEDIKSYKTDDKKEDNEADKKKDEEKKKKYIEIKDEKAIRTERIAPINNEVTLFDEFPLFLNINEVFMIYKKNMKKKEENSYIEVETFDIETNKKYKCEKDIMAILDILYFYFNDQNSNVRWCLAKSFGNILCYLSSENMDYVFKKFEKLSVYNDDNIICTINYSLFHLIFNKNFVSLNILNYLIKKIIQSLYTNKEKVYPATFVLLYSFLKYSTHIKYYYTHNIQKIPFFLFHLIFMKLIVLSLFEDNINIRKSAISLLQFFIGKFNFLYQLQNNKKKKEKEHLEGEKKEREETEEKKEESEKKKDTYNEINCQEQMFSNILNFIYLFNDHNKISNYYASIKEKFEFFINDINATNKSIKDNISNEEKELFENNVQQMNELKNNIFNMNIDLLSTCNFNELLNLKKSIILQTTKVCNCYIYKYPVIYHLYANKLFHENINIRILSAESLSNLSTANYTYFIKVVLPFLIEKSYEENVSTKHGAILCISKILLKLEKTIDEKLQNEIKQIIIYSEKKRIYKYKKGEMLRHCICLLIQSICQCVYFEVKSKTASFFLNIINNNIFHYNEIIQYEAAKIFYYIPIYILNKEDAIQFVFDVFLKIVKEKNNFLHLKGYFILLCFINETIIPYVAPKLIDMFYHALKQHSTYYKLKQQALSRHSKKTEKGKEKEETKETEETEKEEKKKEMKKTFEKEGKKEKNINFKNVNFESHSVDFNMKSFALLALFNAIDKVRNIYIKQFLQVYEECTISFEGLIRSRDPDNFDGYDEKTKNKENSKSCLDTKNNVYSMINEKKFKERNTSFYINKEKMFTKKKRKWEDVRKRGKDKGIDVLNFELNINKTIKIIILYLQEYIFEQDIGDSHIYVRELCLDLTTYLLTAFPIYFFKTTEKIKEKSHASSFLLEKKKNNNNKMINLKNYEMINPNFFYELLSSDDSHEEEEEEEEEEEIKENKNNNIEKKEEDSNDVMKYGVVNEKLLQNNKQEENIKVYLLFEIEKKNVNKLMQLLLKLLCEKNIRTHKKCLFLLNYLFNYAHFNSKKEKEHFHFNNIFKKYCHDFSYELFLKKKIDDNIKKSKKNIYQYLNTYSTDISNVFNNVVIHTCDYYEPIYLKKGENINVSKYLYLKHSIKDKQLEEKIEQEKTKNKSTNICQCNYEEEITEMFFNKNYIYDITKSIFNKINNFIYLYNYALKYTSFSIFHKNKFISTKKAMIKRNINKITNAEEEENKKRDKEIVCNKNIGVKEIKKEHAIKNENKKMQTEKNQEELKFDTITIDNNFVDEINLSENEEKISIAEEEMIKDVHFLLDKTKRNISVIKYLEYNETHLYNHIFYLLFFNKYNYYIISGFFNTLSYYSSTNEYSSYAYTNLIKKEKELSIDFLFLEFIKKYKHVYTYGYIRDNILFLYIRYYTKFFLNYDYSIVDQIIQKKGEKFDEKQNNEKNTLSKNNELSLYDYPLDDIKLKEVLELEQKCLNFNYLKNIFHNYNVFFENNIIMSYEINNENNAKDRTRNKQKIRKENKEIKRKYQDKIELLPYVNICLIKILYYLNNFNLIQLELFLRSVNSFVKFSMINDFSAFCFLNFFHFFLTKYDCFKVIKIMSELIINIYMCPPIHPNVKKFAFFLIINMLLHRYPKIREHCGEYFYANLNFVSPQEVTNYLFTSYENLESVLNILISVNFLNPLKKNDCPIKNAVHEIAAIMGFPLFSI